MSTATGTPVFVTVGGDASAATATYTASGATSSTTVALSDLAASVAENTTAVATANTTAASAVTTANAAQSAATSAASAAASAQTTASAAIPATEIGAVSGVVGIGSDGVAVIPALVNSVASLTLGTDDGNTNNSFIRLGTGLTSSGQAAGFAVLSSWADTTSQNLSVTCSSLVPNTANATALGSANNYWSGIVSESAVQVISDANDKTIVGTIGASDYAAETTKLRAAWAAISGVVYTLNFSTNATKRNHIGVIAQTVQAAFKAQGLDPSDYGLWCSTPKTKQVESTVDGKTVYTTEPVYESDGTTQATQQTVRYEELLSLGIFCERLERADLAARVTALEAKATASTATTSTTSTTA